jgi:hypothetical protein
MANARMDQIDAKDAANILGCSTMHIYNLIRKGDIEPINIGEGERRPRYIFNRDEIEGYARRKMLSKSLESQALKRKISKEVVEDEHAENVRLRDENTKLKLAYSALKRSIKLAMVEYEMEVSNIIDGNN